MTFFETVRASFKIELEFVSVGLWRKEHRRTQRKTFGARTRTNNKLNPDITPGPGIEPRPHWREAMSSNYLLTPRQKLILKHLRTCWNT